MFVGVTAQVGFSTHIIVVRLSNVPTIFLNIQHNNKGPGYSLKFEMFSASGISLVLNSFPLSLQFSLTVKMHKSWSVPFYKLSTIFIYITGNIFDHRKFLFSLYLFQIFLISLRMISTLLLPIYTNIGGEANLKLIVDLIISCYAFALLIHFGFVHEDMADLMRCLREGFSNYSSFQITSESKKGFLNIQNKMKMAEIIMISNCAKVVCLFAVYPLIDDKYDFSSPDSPLSAIFSNWFLKCCSVLFNALTTISACALHNNWLIAMVSSVSCLKSEMCILADSITNIDQRAKYMFDDICRDLESSSWSSYLRSSMSHSQKSAREHITYDETMREMCRLECLKESIRHHQVLITMTAKINKVVGTSALIYTHTVGITVAICLFLIAQADHILSLRVLLYCLIILPTMMSQGLICLFGQDLLDESEDVFNSVAASNWQDKSKRYKSCLRILMLRLHRPLCIRSVIYTINMGNYVEFLKGGYSFLNFLLTMNESENLSK